jgi:hypothetical protein
VPAEIHHLHRRPVPATASETAPPRVNPRRGYVRRHPAFRRCHGAGVLGVCSGIGCGGPVRDAVRPTSQGARRCSARSRCRAWPIPFPA